MIICFYFVLKKFNCTNPKYINMGKKNLHAPYEYILSITFMYALYHHVCLPGCKSPVYAYLKLQGEHVKVKQPSYVRLALAQRNSHENGRTQ